jgi:hypothetical protein
VPRPHPPPTAADIPGCSGSGRRGCPRPPTDRPPTPGCAGPSVASRSDGRHSDVLFGPHRHGRPVDMAQGNVGKPHHDKERGGDQAVDGDSWAPNSLVRARPGSKNLPGGSIHTDLFAANWDIREKEVRQPAGGRGPAHQDALQLSSHQDREAPPPWRTGSCTGGGSSRPRPAGCHGCPAR